MIYTTENDDGSRIITYEKGKSMISKKIPAKRIQRKLPLSHEYEFKSLTQLGGLDGSGYHVCANCSAMIKNLYTVKDLTTGTMHIVGSECVVTLTVNNAEDWLQSEQLFKKTMRAIRKLKKAKHVTPFCDNFGVRIDGTIHRYDFYSDLFKKAVRSLYPQFP